MPPRHRHGYPAALHRGLPARPKQTTREVPRQPNIQQGRTASSPDPPGSSWCALRRRRRRFLAYSSPSRLPDPHHLAVLARPGFVGAASRPPRHLPDQAAPSFNRPAATGRWWWSFTSTRTTNASRRTLREAQETRHERAGPHRIRSAGCCGPRRLCPEPSTTSARPANTASSTPSPRPTSRAGPTRATAAPAAQSASRTGDDGRPSPQGRRR